MIKTTSLLAAYRTLAADNRGRIDPLLRRLIVAVATTLVVFPTQPIVWAAPQELADEDDVAADDFHTLYYSAHLTNDRRVSQLLDQAAQLIADARYSEALPLITRVSLADEDGFYLPSNWQSNVIGLKARADELLASLPAEGRAEYELQRGVAGRRELREAVATGDIDAIKSVLRQFPVTDAAAESAIVLATRAGDSGDVAGAAQLIERVSNWPSNDQIVVASRKLQAARLWSLAGDADKVSMLLTSLAEMGDNVVGQLKIADKPVDSLEKLRKQLLAVANERDASAWAEFISTSWLDPPRWPMEGGELSRAATVPGGAPHLWPRWHARTIREANDLVELKKRRDELIRQRRTWMLATSPIAVGDVVIARTPTQLIAIDWTTGKRVWETRSESAGDDSSSLTLSDESTQNFGGMISLDKVEQRVWLDAVFGGISTDGTRIYSIRGLETVGGNVNRVQWGAIRVFSNQDESDTTATNALVAHDIRHEGKLLWQIDGAIRGETSSGIAFLGPPISTPHGLFALAELNNAIHVVQIDAERGKLDWKQPLVNLERGIGIEAGRRLAGATISYGDGLLVCPTGAGSVVAVDPVGRRLAWAFRFPVDEDLASRNSNSYNRGFGAYQPKLSNQWCRTRVTLAGRRVLVTAPESDELYCLDLNTGESLWERRRQNSLFVGAVADDVALVVSHDSITAVDLVKGNRRWTTGDLPDGATVGGFGVLSEGRYLTPTLDGRLLQIDVATGKVMAASTARDTESLGNLIFHRGAIVSQSIEFVQRFDQAIALRQQATERLAKDADDADALRTMAEFALIDGETAEAVQLLEQAYASAADDPLIRQRLTDALLAGLKDDYAAYREQAVLLDELIPAGSQHVELLRLHIDGCLAEGRADDALAYTWQLFIEDSDRLIRASDDHTVLSERWFNARFRKLWPLASSGAQQQFSDAATQWLTGIGDSGRLESLGRFYRYCHRSAVAVGPTLDLAEAFVADGRRREAELVLLELDSDSLDASQRDRLAHLWQQFNPTNTGSAIASIDFPIGRVRVDQQRLTSATTSNTNRNEQPVRLTLREKESGYRVFGAPQMAIDGLGSELVGWNSIGEVEFRHAVEIEGPQRDSQPECYRFGNFCVLNEQSEVVVLDLLGRSETDGEAVLWRSRADDGSSRSRYVQRFRNGRIVYENRNNAAGMLESRYGQVCAATPCGIIVRNEQQLSCFDPLNGDLLWRRRLDIESDGTALADANYVYLVADGLTGVIVRLTDGEVVGEWKPRDSKFIAVHGANYVVSKLERGRRVIRVLRAGDESALLERDYSSAACFVRGEAGRLYVVEPIGSLDAVDVASGRLLWTSAIAAEPGIDEATTFVAGDTLFVVTNTRTEAQHRAGGHEAVDNAPVADGHVYAIDRATGQHRWPRPATISGLGMLQLQPLDSPVLVFASQMGDSGSASLSALSLLCLDRATGRSLVRNDDLKPLRNQAMVIRVDGGSIPSLSINLDHTLVRLDFTGEPFAPEPVALSEVEAAANRQPAGFLGTLGRILGGGIDASPREPGND